MKNMHVTELMGRLTPADITELELFLKSEFMNRSSLREDVIRLFHILKQAYPKMDSNEIEKEKIYFQLYQTAAVIPGKLEKTASELNKLTRNYLLWKYYNGDENNFQKSIHWGRVLRSLDLDKRYHQQLNAIEREFKEQNLQSPLYYFNNYLLEYEHFYRLSALNRGQEDLNLPELLESLVLFFEVYRIDLLNSALLQQRLTQVEFTPAMQKYLQMATDVNSIDDNPILLISSLIHQLLQREIPDIDDFYLLMNLLKKYEPAIDAKTLREYYAHLRNFCTFLINSGQDQLVPILHQLQRDNLERGFFYIDGKIMAMALLSITRMATMAGNFDWAIAITEDHKDKIIGEGENSEYFQINMALCLIAKGEYDKALSYLPPSCDNLVYHLLARRLEIICFYELKSEIAVYKVEAFKVYMHRAGDKPISTTLLESNKAFGNFIHQIILTAPGDKGRSERIINRIKAKKHVAESKWLLLKAAQLE